MILNIEPVEQARQRAALAIDMFVGWGGELA